MFSLVILWFAGFLAFNYTINNYKPDDQTKTDAIIALTGGRNRIAEAVRLMDLGLAQKLFISGVQKDISLKDINRIQKLQMPDNGDVIIGNRSTNTVENAIETNDWIQKNRVQSIRLVTSNYHIPRSLAEFKSQNPEVKIIPSPAYSNKVSKKWWKSEGTFCLIASEYNKFLYVYIRTSLKGK